MPPDPYERLQAARTAVKALKDERSMLAVRLVDLAKASDEEALVEASMRLDVLPVELLRGFALLARAAGLLGQLAEERRRPIANDIYLTVDRNAAYVDPET